MELENIGADISAELANLIMNDAAANGIDNPQVNFKAPAGYKKPVLGLSTETPNIKVEDGSTTTGLDLARVTKKGGTPEQQAASTAELQQMIEANRASTQRLQQALLGGVSATDAAAKAAVSVGDAQADMANISGGIEIAKLLQTQNINNVLNASVRDPDSVIVDAQKKRREAQIKMDALRPVIDAEDQVQVWDDPLRWIANQFTLPTLKKEYNAAHRTDAAMVERMAETQKLSTSQQAIDPAMTIEDTGRLATAKATAIKFKALEDASRLHAQGSEYLARSIQQDIILNDRSWEQQQSLYKMHQESMSYKRQVDIDAKQTAADRRLQGVTDAISTKLNAIGMPSIDVPTLKTLGQQRAGKLIDWAQYPQLGNGPGESMAAIREFGSDANVAEKDPVLFKFINGLIASPDFKAIAAMKQNDQKFQHMSQQEQREAIVQEVYYKQRSDLDAAKGDNSKLRNDNPYKLIHLNSTLVPELKDNEFTKEVSVIAATSPDKQTVADKDLLNAFLGKVKAEPNKMKEHAAALADYYQKATQYQWLRGGAAVTGYPKFQKYGVGEAVTGKTVNMFSPLELESWATRRMAKQLQAGATYSADTVWGFGGMPIADANE